MMTRTEANRDRDSAHYQNVNRQGSLELLIDQGSGFVTAIASPTPDLILALLLVPVRDKRGLPKVTDLVQAVARDENVVRLDAAHIQMEG